MSGSQFAQYLIDEYLSLLFQPQCLLCKSSVSARLLCSTCAERFLIEAPWCHRCGYPTPMPIQKCGRCRKQTRLAVGCARSLWWLDSSAQSLIHKIKYHGRYEALRDLRTAFERAFVWELSSQACLVPVPLHVRRWVHRGFNQAEEIARWISRRTGMRVEVGALEKKKPTRAQSSLRASSRAKNLGDAFRWRPGMTVPSHIILIDDIYTSGATAEACARAIRRAGGKRIDVFTLFRTPLLFR